MPSICCLLNFQTTNRQCVRCFPRTLERHAEDLAWKEATRYLSAHAVPTCSRSWLAGLMTVGMHQVVPQWAQKTLERHAADPRPLVTLAELETGSTGDELWDAMQQQLVLTGARARPGLGLGWGLPQLPAASLPAAHQRALLTWYVSAAAMLCTRCMDTTTIEETISHSQVITAHTAVTRSSKPVRICTAPGRDVIAMRMLGQAVMRSSARAQASCTTTRA